MRIRWTHLVANEGNFPNIALYWWPSQGNPYLGFYLALSHRFRWCRFWGPYS